MLLLLLLLRKTLNINASPAPPKHSFANCSSTSLLQVSQRSSGPTSKSRDMRASCQSHTPPPVRVPMASDDSGACARGIDPTPYDLRPVLGSEALPLLQACSLMSNLKTANTNHPPPPPHVAMAQACAKVTQFYRR